MPVFVTCVAIALWFWLGDPGRTVASWFWEYEAAPWERVDAFYYPDRSNLAEVKSRLEVGSLEECRDWVYSMAAVNNDPSLMKGDYECAVGEPKSQSGFYNVYRITVR